MPFNFLVQLLIALALNVIAFLLTPRPKVSQPNEVTELEDPTAEAGRPIPVVFGTVLIKSPNTLWYGEKSTEKRSL